ncbi:hypothetical protein JOS77_11740 [Chromobacterium haemolyticum]|nr:hypothetical protein JOS77_11740 [Chromobacterium haemolyticum]
MPTTRGRTSSRAVVQLLFQLVFDDLAFFLHHQDFFQSFGELAHAFRFQRPHHAHLEDAQADVGGQRLVYAQIIQRLHHVQITLATGDDAQPRLGRIQSNVVQIVFARVSQRRVQTVVQHAFFLRQRRVRPADVEAVLGQGKVLRNLELQPLRRDVDDGRAFDGVRDRLDGHPATGIAAHRPAVQAVIYDFLHPGRA